MQQLNQCNNPRSTKLHKQEQGGMISSKPCGWSYEISWMHMATSQSLHHNNNWICRRYWQPYTGGSNGQHDVEKPWMNTLVDSTMYRNTSKYKLEADNQASQKCLSITTSKETRWSWNCSSCGPCHKACTRQHYSQVSQGQITRTARGLLCN